MIRKALCGAPVSHFRIGKILTKTGLVFSFLIANLAILAVPEVAVGQEKVDQVVKVVSDDWGSFEVVGLIIELLTPAAMLYIGLWFDRRIKEFEHRQWSNQKVIEKRLEVYEKITPQLNDLMCYFMRIGAWKERDPTEVVDMKRDIDKVAYIYAPLFSPEFMDRYNEFMSKCFATFRGAGKDAALKLDSMMYREAYVGDDDKKDATWQPEWDECFIGAKDASTKESVGKAYQELVGLIARELGVGLRVDKDDCAKGD